MRLTAELSLYPLDKDYIPIIKAFIDKLNAVDGLHVETHATCSIIHGDDQLVMDTLRDGLRWCCEREDKVVLVSKFLPGHELHGQAD